MYASFGLLIATLIRKGLLTAEEVSTAIVAADVQLSDPGSDLRSVLGSSVPNGVDTLYASRVGAARQRAVALLQAAMVE
jgi:hypothetical protein